MIKNRFTFFLFGFLLSFGAFANDIQALAREQGFFFFYSSSCPHCQHFAPTLKRLSQRYGFSVVAVSVDGGYLPSFPDAVMDNGQSSIFQVTVYPALFLVHPKAQTASLVSEGNIDENELESRLVKISQMQEKQP